jgi:hypothetical protein
VRAALAAARRALAGRAAAAEAARAERTAAAAATAGRDELQCGELAAAEAVRGTGGKGCRGVDPAVASTWSGALRMCLPDSRASCLPSQAIDDMPGPMCAYASS